MQVNRNEEALVLTPETEQDRTLLDALAAAHRPNDWADAPPRSGANAEHRMAEEARPLRPRS